MHRILAILSPNKKAPALALLALTLVAAGCGKSKSPIVVGSKKETEQVLIGEIVAQHLEHRLTRKVERRLGLGGELITFQALTAGEITLYPAYTGSIVTAILKEQASTDRDIVRERARSEMLRTAQLDLLDPLGYDSPPVVVISASDAEKDKIKNLSGAAADSFRWKLGMSYEFQQRGDVLPAINVYKLPMAQGVRGMDAAQLFPALTGGQLNMIAVSATDGHLASSDFQVLNDDKAAFPSYQACLLVRRSALIEEPPLRAALAELAGKLKAEVVRKMDAEVDLNHRKTAEVASDFLASIGLK